ncbi:MAG: thioredoxin family protein [Methanoregula sp.]
MDKIIKIAAGLTAVIILCVALFFFFPGSLSSGVSMESANPGSTGNAPVYFFYGEECPHCHNVMPLVKSLEQKYPNVEFQYLEIWHNETNYAFYYALNQELKTRYSGVPQAIVGDTVLNGERDIPAGLEQAILNQIKKKP